MTLKATFDGHVIVPDEPVNLPAGSSVRVTIERDAEAEPKVGIGPRLNEWLSRQQIDVDAVAEMQQAINDDCGKVDVDGW
jgi:hypothetical protein